MSLTASQKILYHWASRPPGPTALWYAVGSTLRTLGKGIDTLGVALQGDCAQIDKLPIPCTAVKFGGKAPAIDAASFVAPSATLVGAVELGEGSSVWYASMLKGDTAPVTVGEKASIGDRSIITGSTIGANVCIGASSVISASTIADGSSIGMGCTIGKGCTVGEGAVVTSGSVLPAGTTVPAGQMWSGAPAVSVGTVSDADAQGIVATAELSSALGGVHMDECWKEPALVLESMEDYKRQEWRFPERLSQLREDPDWVPMPTLGGFLEKEGVYDMTYVPK